ncbi:MAG: DUF523 domain-containing protein [Erysipelotrichaceae bacterium]|nr:DUF523 domain-containing protein [Erysipelotrichaceae bacterium]
MFMEKILISACLVGDKCKYDGKSNYTPLVKELLEKYELVPFCPEVEGGLSIPRTPSERKGDIIINQNGKDVTKYFELGAEKAYNICMYLGIKIAILKENSPSCGVNTIYDGSFSHKTINGQGYTAEYLSKRGIRVISENDISSLL